jgi:hypothetical protein
VDPLIGFALEHAKQAPMHHLEGVGLEVGQEEEQAIFRCRQRAILVDGKSAGRPGCPIEAPRRHMRLERDLEGRDQDLKFLERQAGEIQKLCRARLRIGKP